jgi:hypothetical protein
MRMMTRQATMMVEKMSTRAAWPSNAAQVGNNRSSELLLQLAAMSASKACCKEDSQLAGGGCWAVPGSGPCAMARE